MPRRSLEALAAYQAVHERPKPPPELRLAAIEIWNKIVGERPADFFSEGNIPLLAIYCRTLVQANRMLRVMETRTPGTPEYAKHARTVTALVTIVESLAVKMRLTQQQQMRVESGKIRDRTTIAPIVAAAALGGSDEFTMRAN